MVDPGTARDSALDRLPPVYARALRLRDAGVSAKLMADCLGIEPEALTPLLEIADAKLAAQLDDPRRTTS